MSLEQQIQILVDRIDSDGATLENEEATKNALILPMLRALGYDVFNPNEVRPEFSADTPGRRAEKVDYAIFLNGDIEILVECKALRSSLKPKEVNQLFRYFSATSARLAVLTDGETYKFYTDLDASNLMDAQPFLVIRLEQLNSLDLRQLEKFEKRNFDIDKIVADAEDLKFRSSIKKELSSEFSDPSEEFVRMLSSRVFPGNITSKVREKFAPIVKSAAEAMIRETVNRRLRDAIQATTPTNDEKPESETDEAVTTDMELKGFHIVQAIAAKATSPTRVGFRDAKAYCAILLDDNNRKPVCRLHFNNENRLRISIGREPEKHELTEVRDIYRFSDEIRRQVLQMDS